MQHLFTKFDEFLNEKQLFRKHVAKDSSCLFRCFAEVVYKSQMFHSDVKQDLLRYVSQHQDEEMELELPLRDYVDALRTDKYFGTKNDVKLLSKIYCETVVIWTNHKQSEAFFYSNSVDAEPMILAYDEDNCRFDLIYTQEYMELLAVAQSVVYETIYSTLLGFDRDYLQKLSKQMLEEKHFVRLKKRRRALQKNSAEADSLDENELPPVSYKVAKCLCVKRYRNEAFDIWALENKEYLNQLLRTPQLALGVRCKVLVDSIESVGYVQRIDDKVVEVYVVEKTTRMWFRKDDVRVLPTLRKDKRWLRRHRAEAGPFTSSCSNQTFESDIPAQNSAIAESSSSEAALVDTISYYVNLPTFNIQNSSFIFPTSNSIGDALSPTCLDASPSTMAVCFCPHCKAFIQFHSYHGQ